MERIRPTLPKDIDMQLVWDGTMFMESALKEITKTLGETIMIVALVVFLFMGSLRTALVPLVAIPVSLIGAGAFMLAFGFSLNLLTILAIVLAVGLVVDDAIVVVENVERHVRLGKSRIEAALIGARELIGPIIAMTVTLATVYIPIGFQGGLTGSLFLEFAITLAAAVVLSGIVALTLSPFLSSRILHPHGQQARLTRLVNRVFDRIRARYATLLDGALTMRWSIVGASVLVIAAAWPMYQQSRKELAPIEDQSHISLFMESAPNASLEAEKAKEGAALSPQRGDFDEEMYFGTVGAVALDRHGNLAAGTSTGGREGKLPGRVGDSPLVGAGTYANNETLAVSSTGLGEHVMRTVAAKEMSDLMALVRLSVAEATERVRKKIADSGGSIGVIAIDRTGKGIRTAPRDALITRASDAATLGTSFGVQHRAERGQVPSSATERMSPHLQSSPPRESGPGGP